MNSRRVLATLLALGMVGLIGCTSESTTPVEPAQPQAEPIQRATISGKIIDMCTNDAIAGAVMSLGHDGSVQTVTSDASGSFSFADVPVDQYQILSGTTVASGTYTITASLVSFNAAETDTAKRYRDYYYKTATIKYTSTVDSTGLLGLAGGVLFGISTLNTQISGTIVDKDMQPVTGAIVTLFDQSVTPGVVLQQATSGASGQFVFNHVDNGITVMIQAQTTDGTLRGALGGALTMPCNLPGKDLLAQVNAEQIMITASDDVAPYVISLTPQNNADVDPSGLAVVYTFSEPIKQTPYTRTDLGVGHGTIMDAITINYNGFKKVAGPVLFTGQWNATYTQLTITPTSLVGASKYTLNATAAFTSGNLQDAAGNAVVNNASIVGDFEALNFTTNGASTVPAAPTLTRRMIPGTYVNLDYAGGVVGLEWSYDANARSYNLYKSVDGGPFELLQSGITNLFTEDNPSGTLVYPQAATNPLRAINIQYVVRGVSKDLAVGAASAAVTVTDQIQPRLTVAGVASAAPPANTWLYTLQFSEPLTVAGAEAVGNYTFSNTGGVTYTINNATYVGLVGGTYRVLLTVTTSAAPIAGYVLTVGTGVTDLAGNAINSGFNSNTF